MMWKKAQSKFKNASPDDFNRHPSCRLSYSADCVASMTANLNDLVWSTDDGTVMTTAVDFSKSTKPPRRLPSAPVAQAVQFAPFLGAHSRLALLAPAGLHLYADTNDAAPTVVALPGLPAAARRSAAGLAWNRSAQGVVALARGGGATVVDVVGAVEVWSGETGGQARGVDWNPTGAVAAVALDDGDVMRCDPRAGSVEKLLSTAMPGEGRVVWTAEANHVLVSGCDKTRERHVRLYDVRATGSAVGHFSCGRGQSAVELLYDPDTGMLFSFAKGDMAIAYSEVLSEGADALCNRGKSMYNGSVAGAALAPRVGLDLMNCEVARLYVACGERILQARYRIPRKSYSEFYPDVYEATSIGEPSVTNEEWSSGTSYLAKRAHLTPQMQLRLMGGSDAPAEGGDVKDRQSEAVSSPAPAATPATVPPALRQMPQRRVVTIDPGSKFKHIQGKVEHKSKHLGVGRALESRVPPECDMVVANGRFVAYQVVGAGSLEVQDRSQNGRVVVVENGSSLQAFALDSLVDCRLAVGCSDGGVRVWTIPEEGDLVREPDLHLRSHNAKVTHVLFHRSVVNLLLTAAFDGQILFWNLADSDSPLLGHLDAGRTLMGISWSPDGDCLAAVDDAGKLRVWPEPRVDGGVQEVVTDGSLTNPGRSARVAWLQDDVLVVSGFQGTKRMLAACQLKTADGSMSIVEADRYAMETTTPSVLNVCVDVDKMLVLAVGRGDQKVRVFDFAGGSIAEAVPFSSEQQLQGLCLVSPLGCDVRRHQVAVGYLLTQTTVQPVSFMVPRVKTDYFHDDLFPDCSSMAAGAGATSADRWWTREASARPPFVSLRPSGMPLYSVWREEEEERRRQRATEFTPLTEAALREPTEKERQAELVASMQKIIDSNSLHYGGAQQSEGVDSDEWEDD